MMHLGMAPQCVAARPNLLDLVATVNIFLLTSKCSLYSGRLFEPGGTRRCMIGGDNLKDK